MGVSIGTRIEAALKAWSFGGTALSPWAGGFWGWGTFANSAIDYQTEAGDLRLNSIIMASLGPIVNAFPEPPPQVLDSKGAPVDNHPALALFATPNPYYSEELLRQALVADYRLTGEAFCLLQRTADRRTVVGLWYEPAWSVRPVWPRDGSAYLSGYELYRGGRWDLLEFGLEDVVHFRYALDPQNLRRGVSPLLSALREVYTDNEAGAYIASLLKNAAVPPIIFSPKDGAVIADPDEFKREYMRRFSGDKRGEPMVTRTPMDIQTLGFPPSALNLRDARTTPEERIAGLMGVPAMVSGLGAGLARSTFSNYAEAVQFLYNNTLIPFWRVFGTTWTQRLLPVAGGRPGERLVYDLRQVRALQDDQDAKAKRLDSAFLAGRISRAEARTAEGYEARPHDEVFIVPKGAVLVPSNTAYLTPDAAPPAELPEAPALRRVKLLPPAASKAADDDWAAAEALWAEYAEESVDADA